MGPNNPSALSSDILGLLQSIASSTAVSSVALSGKHREQWLWLVPRLTTIAITESLPWSDGISAAADATDRENAANAAASAIQACNFTDQNRNDLETFVCDKRCFKSESKLNSSVTAVLGTVSKVHQFEELQSALIFLAISLSGGQNFCRTLLPRFGWSENIKDLFSKIDPANFDNTVKHFLSAVNNQEDADAESLATLLPRTTTAVCKPIAAGKISLSLKKPFAIFIVHARFLEFPNNINLI